MNLIVVLLVLLLLCGGAGFYFAGPVVGGVGFGLVLLVGLLIFFMGGLHSET